MATRLPAARGAARLDSFVGARLPPSSSSVADIYRETTVCYAYMCPYAYACTEKAARPAQVLTRRCMRYSPSHCESPRACPTWPWTCSPAAAPAASPSPQPPPPSLTASAPKGP